MAAAAPASPVNGANLSCYSQPITLTVAAGASTGKGPITDTFEVATDPAFANRVLTSSVQQAALGPTSVTVSQLAPSSDYYWRVKTASADNPGTVSSVLKFTLGPRIDAPVPLQPPPNSFQHKRPTLAVSNVAHSNLAAPLMYQFEIAADAEFRTVVVAGTMPEGTTQTSFTPSSDLPSGASLFWRVRAVDTVAGSTGNYSMSTSFTTVNPDDGTFPYTLDVHFPSTSACQRYGSIDISSDFTFDSTCE